MKALILIGGLGTRLRPLTCFTPKPLLPLANRPFLEYQFLLLKKYGIKEVILCVAYLQSEFKKYLGSGKKWGIKIRYVNEKEPLGTGGAIRNACKYIDGTTVVFNGDILSDIDLSKLIKSHKSKRASATIALTRVKDPTVYGLVETDKAGWIESFIEKPSWDDVTCNTVNAGIYVFEPKIINDIQPGVNISIEREVFPKLLKSKAKLHGHIFKGYWMDIGTIDKYLQSSFDLLSGKLNLELPGRKISRNIRVGKNVRIHKTAHIEGKLICADNVRIGEYVQMSGYVSIGNRVKIGKGVNISNSIILDNTIIEDGAKIESALIGKKCIIGANSSLSKGSAISDGTVINKYSRI